MNIKLKEIKNEYSITLHKVNEEVIGEIPSCVLTSITRNLDDIDEVELLINKYYINNIDKQKKEYYFYELFKVERLIALNGEFFVIKNISEDNINNTKTIKAYGYEKKLEKNDIIVEGVGFMLLDKDEENLIFSLNEYMYDEIGWKIGHVDNKIRYSNYSPDEINLIPRMRWQESLSQDWYSFLAKTIAEQFEAIAVFDRENKLVNYYSIDGFGENIGIALSKDNYIKSLQRVSDSNEIITRMKLAGNAEKCFVNEYIPSGYDYIENFSYFIENGEMSNELINAINKHNEMIKDLPTRWKELKNSKIEKEDEKTQLENLLFFNLQEYDTSKSIAKEYRYNNDAVNAALWETKCTELIDERVLLEDQIKTKQQELEIIVTEMNEINKKCRRYSATNENGEYIFSQALLDELKLFVFQGTYSDDAFYNAEELISVGERDLDNKCKPTETFSIDNKNFISRLIDNGFRQHWNGELGLGDIILLYDRDKDKEEFVFLVSYNQNFKDKSLSLELSNKKTKENCKRNIAMWMKSAKILKEESMKSRYVINQLKNYRYNL